MQQKTNASKMLPALICTEVKGEKWIRGVVSGIPTDIPLDSFK